MISTNTGHPVKIIGGSLSDNTATWVLKDCPLIPPSTTSTMYLRATGGLYEIHLAIFKTNHSTPPKPPATGGFKDCGQDSDG